VWIAAKPPSPQPRTSTPLGPKVTCCRSSSAAGGTSCGPPPIGGPEQLMTTVTSRRSRTLRDAAAAADRLSTIHLSPTCSRGESHASPYRVATRPARQSGTHRTSTSPLPAPPLRFGFAAPPLSVLVNAIIVVPTTIPRPRQLCLSAAAVDPRRRYCCFINIVILYSFLS